MVVKKNKTNESFESDFTRITGYNIDTDIIEECLDIIGKVFDKWDDIYEFKYAFKKLYFKANDPISDDYWVSLSYDTKLNDNALTLKIEGYNSTDYWGLPFTQDIMSNMCNKLLNMKYTPEYLFEVFTKLENALKSQIGDNYDEIDLLDFLYYDY